MKRMFTTALLLALAAGTPALAGPEHAEHRSPEQAKQPEAKRPTLKELLPEIKAPKLWIGSDAPSLEIAEFIKGYAPSALNDGKVHVVEFWATWCGPCIAAFPHLTELQTQYEGRVQFLGVNVWEQKTGQERLEMVRDFVADQGERMGYTVAIETGSDMSDTWLRPANQNGIPAAFIVDGSGKIAWIGHPMSMEEPLEQVVAGTFDAKKAAAEALEAERFTAAFREFQSLAKSGKNFPRMNDLGEALIAEYLSDEPRGLNAIAWMIVSSEAEGVRQRDYMLAHRAAALACEATEWKDWSVLDTYAAACMKVGSPVEAAKWEQKALDLMPPEAIEARPELEARLAEFKQAIED